MIIYLEPKKQKIKPLHIISLFILLFNINVSKAITEAEAARFLNQATFGARLNEIQALSATGTYEGWVDDQISKPTSLILPISESLWLRTCPTDSNGDLHVGSNLYANGGTIVDRNLPNELRDTAWWDLVLNSDDQLRQRVAFALSEIFVTADAGGNTGSTFGLADYYDVLINNAFGNYRDLLKEVTLHPMMGVYLSMIKNQKADPSQNIRPDENYAREILQLFSIGVNMLNIDGTLQMDNGSPVASYTQTTIQEFAKVFTGWNYENTDPNDPNTWNIYIDNGATTEPMIPWEIYHDSTNTKALFNNIVLQPGRTAMQDLDDALDNIFAHPNVGPFISKRLIQRLTTSNPSPEYIGRIAAVFNDNDNGNGIRGDLGAVVKAILLDTEAINGTNAVAHFGKLREPLLRLSHIRRSLGVRPVAKTGEFWTSEVPPDSGNYIYIDCGRASYDIYRTYRSAIDDFGQGIFRSPSVFNFFFPDFAPFGEVSNANLVAPEFQIITENTMANLNNEINSEIINNGNTGERVTILIDEEISVATDLNALLDHLDLLLMDGNMPTDLRGLLFTHLNDAPFPSNDLDKRTQQVKDALILITSSPDYLIQK